MHTRLNWWQARADDVAVGLLTALFFTFVLQITARYVFEHPLEWTLELCLTLWLWTVFWGSSFCLKDSDHVRFDMLHQAVGPKTRQVFDVVASVVLVVVMLIALLPTYDFISFVTIKKSASLRIPLGWVFSIYLVFMLAIIVGYAIRLRNLLRAS
jgi:TRAP-type C4-dicarboxylate transport system permease small subunit